MEGVGKTDASSGKKDLYFAHATSFPSTTVANYTDTIMGAASAGFFNKTMEYFFVAAVIMCHRNCGSDRFT